MGRFGAVNGYGRSVSGDCVSVHFTAWAGLFTFQKISAILSGMFAILEIAHIGLDYKELIVERSIRSGFVTRDTAEAYLSLIRDHYAKHPEKYYAYANPRERRLPDYEIVDAASERYKNAQPGADPFPD